jgi:hypothetical protein
LYTKSKFDWSHPLNLTRTSRHSFSIKILVTETFSTIGVETSGVVTTNTLQVLMVSDGFERTLQLDRDITNPKINK